MPLYEYACRKCSHEFELIRSFNDSESLPICPKCNSKTKRLLSVFGAQNGTFVKPAGSSAMRKPNRPA